MDETPALLIVDDERDILESVERLFRKQYRVHTADSPERAHAILAEHEVQVVLSDQRMPTQSGVDFLTELRREHPDIVRVLMTGYSNIDHVIDAINAGHVYRYVSKPWEPTELRLLVQQCFERWQAENERNRLLRELSRQNEELVRKNDELKTLDRLKDVFMEVVSHELNTPVAVVLGYATLLHRELRDTENDVIHKALLGIEAGGNRLKKISNQVFQLLEQDESPSLVFEELDVAETLAQLQRFVSPFLAKRSQTLECIVDPDAQTCSGDQAKLDDALLNVIMNAIKFSPDGQTIVVNARGHDEEFIAIDVRDSGIGISDEDISRIFDPFFSTFESQHHSSGMFEFGKRGIGLGLSVAKRFVEQHGGRIEVTTNRERGSTFTVYLPRHGLLAS